MPYGGGIRAIEHHSESREAIYAHTPGLKVVTPATVEDAYSLLREALSELRTKSRTDPRTVEAFEMLVYHGLSPQVVAEQMGMSTHDVYLAKSRVAAKLREIVVRLEAEYEEAPGEWDASGSRPSDGLRGG